MRDKIILTGHTLDLESLHRIAMGQAEVCLCLDAMEEVERANQILLESVTGGKRIYGASCGVGWNKDQSVSLETQCAYNRSLLRSHAVSLPPYASVPEVRSMMAIRLNKALLGHSGLSKAVLFLYRDFLNEGITPCLPKRGSIGEADIASLSHIGLAMLGEGEVDFRGRRVPALEAMEDCRLTPLVPGIKDGLGIISSNAHGEAIASMLVLEAEHLLSWINLIFCLSLEGLKGSLKPFGEEVNRIRRQDGQIYCASVFRHHLRDSYLRNFEETPSLQDPLSFRCAAAIHGACFEALGEAKRRLVDQINTSDDNPAILTGEKEIVVSTNFETLGLALAIEKLSLALSHLSRTIVFRCFCLGDPDFTGLGRFLSPEEGKCIAFGTLQKTLSALDTEIRHLAQPSSFDFLPLAGRIEDHSSNLPFVAEKARSITEALSYLASIELIHASQAVTLRTCEALLATDTGRLMGLVRTIVEPYLEDRSMTPDVEALKEFLVCEPPFVLPLILKDSCSGDYREPGRPPL